MSLSKRLLVLAAIAGSASAVNPALAAVTPRATTARAERNLLGAVRVFTHWNVGLTDRRTGLLPANTTARCAGRGKARHGAFASFVCVIRRDTLRIRVLYVVLRHNGFELRDHRVIRG